MGVQTAEETVLRTRVTMSLRGRKPSAPAAPTKLKNFRCPEHIDAYLKKATVDLDRTETDIIILAIELDRDLGVMLADDNDRISALAGRMGLDPDRDLAKVLAALVKHGLDKVDAEADANTKKRR